jgi:hypothetical protein
VSTEIYKTAGVQAENKRQRELRIRHLTAVKQNMAELFKVSHQVRVHFGLDEMDDSEATQEEVAKMFDRVDVDGSGELDAGEFREVLAACSTGVSQEQMGLVWTIVDAGKRGVITFDQFCDFMNMRDTKGAGGSADSKGLRLPQPKCPNGPVATKNFRQIMQDKQQLVKDKISSRVGRQAGKHCLVPLVGAEAGSRQSSLSIQRPGGALGPTGTRTWTSTIAHA